MARKRKNQKTSTDVRLISKDGVERDFKAKHAERLLRYPNSSWRLKQEAILIQEDAGQTD